MPLAALLLAATLVAPATAPPAPAFHLDEVPVGVRLEVVAEPAAPSPQLRWRSDGEARVGVAEDARLQATVRIAPAGPGTFALTFSVVWRVAAAVEREAIRLVSARHRARGRPRPRARRAARAAPGRPRHAHRGRHPSGGRARWTRGSSPRATRPRATLSRWTSSSTTPGRTPSPFTRAASPPCPGLAEGAAIPFAALEHKKFLGRTARRAGERVEAHATLVVLAPAAAALPLVPERWPAGARAAVVFTDHADRTDPLALRALLYGSSAVPAGAATAPGGFLGHGVRLTKSFFVRAHRGGLQTDPEARALAVALRAAGSEVASHSISGGPDNRAAVVAGLPALQAFGVVTWIDHEPYTNCEAFSSEGWRTEGRYGIRDLLALAGIRWVWEAGDVGGFRSVGAGGPLLERARRARPAPPIYPLPMDPRLWVFDSTMFYAPPRELAAALSDAALEKLEARRGLFVGHTYLSASRRTTTRPEHLARLVVREEGGALVLDPAFDQALARIGRHVRAGRLASLTWAEAGDRLRALGEVNVAYLPDGSARVENRGSAPLLGLTLAVPAEVELQVDGPAVAGRSAERGRTRAWLDLPPGGAALVRATRGGALVPFLAPRAGATLRP